MRYQNHLWLSHHLRLVWQRKNIPTRNIDMHNVTNWSHNVWRCIMAVMPYYYTCGLFNKPDDVRSLSTISHSVNGNLI